ncbi:MAG: DinB family protein [Paracoccus sp. (in: a-proteobacteria)]|uniref:DinB family protein n=1 Tax=Paracoccus sp. TaxID=267 RepID=UPI00391993A5
MPDQTYALTMARYNLWQNHSMTEAVSRLPSDERDRDRGAFFGSIRRTFHHIFWGDRVWMSRFAGLPAPEGGLASSTGFPGDWAAFCLQRQALDHQIVTWAHDLNPVWFGQDNVGGMASSMAGRAASRAELVMHMFNHQTHHRGQIHAMITAAGGSTGATDLFRMPDPYRTLTA